MWSVVARLLRVPFGTVNALSDSDGVASLSCKVMVALGCVTLSRLDWSRVRDSTYGGAESPMVAILVWVVSAMPANAFPVKSWTAPLLIMTAYCLFAVSGEFSVMVTVLPLMLTWPSVIDR